MPSLAERLKAETHSLHRAAERSTFMGVLLRGRMERPAYCDLLRNLHAVYAALEPALARHAHHPAIAPVLLPGLGRAPALADDLRVLHGDSWAEDFGLQPASTRYVNRLHAIDTAQPGLLLAHAYVRYLGDLSGGQLLRRIVADSLRPPAGSGIAFYQFGGPAATLALTQAFRAGLEKIVVDAAGVDALVAEARLAFELHRSLFDELAHAHRLADDPRAAAATRAGG